MRILTPKRPVVGQVDIRGRLYLYIYELLEWRRLRYLVGIFIAFDQQF